jgi:hypothetical protein
VRESDGESYYLSQKAEIMALYGTHAQAWRPFLVERYGGSFAEEVIEEARHILEGLIPELPDIGGDSNPLTRHIIRCSTSLALYKAMKTRGTTAEETGRIIYEAVVESVRHMRSTPPPTEEDLAQRREHARTSRQRRYSGGWVWDFVEGDGETFEYGYDFYECGTQKLYHAQGADDFLPFFCYLDFVTYRTSGWSFSRTMTLAQGDEKCDFRFSRGGETEKGWPPPFLEKQNASHD